VLLTYQRPAHAQRAILEYCAMTDVISRVLVVANDPSGVVAARVASQALGGRCDIMVWRSERNSLNARFEVAAAVDTLAVLSGAVGRGSELRWCSWCTAPQWTTTCEWWRPMCGFC
jgi:hypothetical protein